jgi:hypothetical protein
MSDLHGQQSGLGGWTHGLALGLGVGRGVATGLGVAVGTGVGVATGEGVGRGSRQYPVPSPHRQYGSAQEYVVPSGRGQTQGVGVGSGVGVGVGVGVGTGVGAGDGEGLGAVGASGKQTAGFARQKSLTGRQAASDRMAKDTATPRRNRFTASTSAATRCTAPEAT